MSIPGNVRRSRSDDPVVIIVMGVTASGKTTLAHELADRTKGWLVEGDDHHPASNIAKMISGVPLQDEDRWPWLDRLADAIRQSIAQNHVTICTCSALKRSYRDRLRLAVNRQLWFVCLQADKSVLERRSAGRSGHFMPQSLLSSQLNVLELPDDEDDAFVLSSENSRDELVRAVLHRLRLTAPDGAGA
jgi:gluconokinase